MSGCKACTLDAIDCAAMHSDERLSSLAHFTLRDLFAACTMMGMFARDDYDPGLATPQQRARLAYIQDDALLAEREVIIG